MEKVKKVKKKILDALAGYKKFAVSFVNEVRKEKTIKARNEQEIRDRFFAGTLDLSKFTDTDEDCIEDSLEIAEIDD